MKLSDLKRRIEELDAKATKGPWFSECDGEFVVTKKEGITFDIAVLDVCLRSGASPNSEHDADFIALSRTAMPELLRRLLVAEESLQQIIWDTCNHPHIQEMATAALATIRGEEE